MWSFAVEFLSCVCVCDVFLLDVFLRHSHKNTNTAFRLVKHVYDLHMNRCEFNISAKHAQYE